jgi:hypothetical protein
VIGIVNKETTNPNGVFSGETRTFGGQNGSRTRQHCTILTYLADLVLMINKNATFSPRISHKLQNPT